MRQVHLSETRVEHTLQKLGEMEVLVNDMMLQQKASDRVMPPALEVSVREEALLGEAPGTQVAECSTGSSRGKALDISGPVAPYPARLKNFWYPVAFSSDIDAKTMVRLTSSFWTLFERCPFKCAFFYQHGIYCVNAQKSVVLLSIVGTKNLLVQISLSWLIVAKISHWQLRCFILVSLTLQSPRFPAGCFDVVTLFCIKNVEVVASLP